MNKNKIQYILLFLIVITNPRVINAQKNDYNVYHDSINYAEHLFLAGKNKESVALYNRIFSKYSFVFAKDCLIAGQIAILLNDSTHAIIFTERAITQGVKITYFSQLPIYKKFIKQESWKKIKFSYKEGRINYQKSIDFERKKKWASRYSLEQELKNVKTMSAYKIKMLENIKYIVKETEDIGFPGEKLLGIDDNIFSPKKNDDNITNDMAYISLLHYACSYELMKKYFSAEIKKGNIHPRYCAYLADFLKIIRKNADADNCNTASYPAYYIDWISKIEKESLIKINTNREKLHICSVEQDKEKEIFQDKTGVKLSFGFGMHKGAL